MKNFQKSICNKEPKVKEISIACDHGPKSMKVPWKALWY